MSTASASPTLTTLPERAFSLHCSGLRSPAIAQQLGVPERTVRAWIARIRDDIATENTALLREEFIRAVEHLHQLSAAAWAAFEDEQAQAHSPATVTYNDDLAIGETAARPPSLASASPTDSPLLVGEGSGVRSPRHSPRYLRLALDAQRHISRIFGHFDDLRAGSLDLNTASTPASPAAPPAPVLAPVFSPAPDTEFEIPAKTATTTAPPPSCPSVFSVSSVVESRPPAESATGASDAETEFPAESAMPPSSSVNLRSLRSLRVEPRPRIPAKTATASGSPRPAGEGSGVRFPAKTATSPSRPDTTPAFPATVPIHWRM